MHGLKDAPADQPLAEVDSAVDSAHDKETEARRTIRCRACDHVLTHHQSRIDVAGAHQHVQINPSGIPFDIGCFGVAPGVLGVGPFETYWSWFAGYGWQVATCGGCAAHVGWVFARSSADRFYGLILSRLRES